MWYPTGKAVDDDDGAGGPARDDRGVPDGAVLDPAAEPASRPGDGVFIPRENDMMAKIPCLVLGLASIGSQSATAGGLLAK